MDEVSVDIFLVLLYTLRGRGLVRVMQRSETAKAGFDIAVGGGEGHAEVGVEGAGALELVVGFVDGVGEVEGYDGDVDAAAVFGEAGGAGLRARVAGADGQAVVEGLRPACDELDSVGQYIGLSLHRWLRKKARKWKKTPAEKSQRHARNAKGNAGSRGKPRNLRWGESSSPGAKGAPT